MTSQTLAAAAIATIALCGTLPHQALAVQQAQTPPDHARLGLAPLDPERDPQSFLARQEMLPVPAGGFSLGRNDGPRIESPAHPVELEAFRIDRIEVTNAAFAEYLNALSIPVAAPFEAGRASRTAIGHDRASLLLEGPEGSGLYPIIALDDEQARLGYGSGSFVPTPGYEDHPVTETTWAGARAYCAWRGARLPTEAEWEAAARGFDGRLYPWGDTAPDPSRVFLSGQAGVTAAAGERPAGASPFGALDMSGSLAE